MGARRRGRTFRCRHSSSERRGVPPCLCQAGVAKKPSGAGGQPGPPGPPRRHARRPAEHLVHRPGHWHHAEQPDLRSLVRRRQRRSGAHIGVGARLSAGIRVIARPVMIQRASGPLCMFMHRRPRGDRPHLVDSVRLHRSRNERYLERLPWRMHGRYDHGRTGRCHMYGASTTSASRSQISTS
jgi:hypothetical protein